MTNLYQMRYALAGMMCVFLVAGCGKKMGEQDYIQEAQKYLNNGRFHEAVALYDEFLERYPDSEFAPKSMFMTGFIYANNLQDFENARKYYEKFLERYPNNELAISVKWEIENLGTDVNRLIQEADDAARRDSLKDYETGSKQ